jgi:hypothetical protein
MQMNHCSCEIYYDLANKGAQKVSSVVGEVDLNYLQTNKDLSFYNPYPGLACRGNINPRFTVM